MLNIRYRKSKKKNEASSNTKTPRRSKFIDELFDHSEHKSGMKSKNPSIRKETNNPHLIAELKSVLDKRNKVSKE